MELFFVDPGTKINDAYYHDNLLQQKLLPVIQCVSGTNFIFQQDSAPAHHVRKTAEVLHQETPYFIFPDLWPPNSPDLNPVDYEIWAVMQRRVYQRKIHTIDELKQLQLKLKFGAALNSRLSTWLLISGTEDLELVFMRRKDTSNIAFELSDCLDFFNLLSPDLLCFV